MDKDLEELELAYIADGNVKWDKNQTYPAIPILVIYSGGGGKKKSMYPYKDLYMKVQSNLVWYSPKLEATQILING